MMIFQNAMELMDQRVKTAKWDHAQELMDQKMDQLEPHALELNQRLSHTITKTQPLETHITTLETSATMLNNTQPPHGLDIMNTQLFNFQLMLSQKLMAQRK